MLGLTQGAKAVVDAARTEAMDDAVGELTADHLLVALAQIDGPARAVFEQLGVSADRMRRTQRSAGNRSRSGTRLELRVSSELDRVFELARLEAARLGSTEVDIEHLLMGLTDLARSEVTETMISVGAGPELVRVVLADSLNKPVGQRAVVRNRPTATVLPPPTDWVRVSPDEPVLRLVAITASRVWDTGRLELEPSDLLLGFTLVPGPVDAGPLLGADERVAAEERDRAWGHMGHVKALTSINPSASTLTVFRHAAAYALADDREDFTAADLLAALSRDTTLFALLDRLRVDYRGLARSSDAFTLAYASRQSAGTGTEGVPPDVGVRTE